MFINFDVYFYNHCKFEPHKFIIALQRQVLSYSNNNLFISNGGKLAVIKISVLENLKMLIFQIYAPMMAVSEKENDEFYDQSDKFF